MSNDEINKKSKILSDLADKLGKIETSRNFEYNIIAGRQVPTPSFSLKPKNVIVKPKNDDEK
jgi:hypothetical protein